MVELTLTNLAFAASVLVINVVCSFHLGLQLESPIIVGAVRSIVQLNLLAVVLKPVLERTDALVVLALASFQLLLAVLEVRFVRSKLVHKHMLACLLFATAASTASVSILGATFALGAVPFYEPKTFIPTFGMLLGNCMTTIAISLDSYLQSVDDGKERLELMLSFGASGFEASKPLMVNALRIGLLPGLNSMAIIGLISIPGTITGMILAGSSIEEAIRYQNILLFLICGCNCIGAITSLILAQSILFRNGSLSVELLKS